MPDCSQLALTTAKWWNNVLYHLFCGALSASDTSTPPLHLKNENGKEIKNLRNESNYSQTFLHDCSPLELGEPELLSLSIFHLCLWHSCQPRPLMCCVQSRAQTDIPGASPLDKQDRVLLDPADAENVRRQIRQTVSGVSLSFLVICMF